MPTLNFPPLVDMIRKLESDRTLRDELLWEIVKSDPALAQKYLTGIMVAKRMPSGLIDMSADDIIFEICHREFKYLPASHQPNDYVYLPDSISHLGRNYVSVAYYNKVYSLYNSKGYIEAIKELRHLTKFGLKEAKDVVDYWFR